MTICCPCGNDALYSMPKRLEEEWVEDREYIKIDGDQFYICCKCNEKIKKKNEELRAWANGEICPAEMVHW